MTDHTNKRTSPPLPALIATALVVLGVLLWMFVSKSLLIVAGLGAFGPGILRELGWLQDQDEFQRQAAHRAGYHAYLIGGFAVVALISVLDWAEGNLAAQPEEWIRFILVMLWGSWMFSALLSYWGTQKTTSIILMTFGSFWAVFVIASGIGEAQSGVESQDAIWGILAGAALIAAFFVPAWTVRHWPRSTGVVLLLLSVALGLVFGGKGGLQWSTVILTKTLLIGPILVCGMALLREQNSERMGDFDSGDENFVPGLSG